MRKKYHVQPMKSWGKLPESHIITWKSKHCDMIFTATRMTSKPLSICLTTSSSSIDGNPDSHPNMAASLPLIAIMAATTTRKVHKPSTDNLALFNYLLPSLVRTLDCGYRYEYVLGYDMGDPYYDSEEVSLCLSLSLSFFLSFCLCVCLSVSQSVCLSLYPCYYCFD
jgi:hypothetical protein